MGQWGTIRPTHVKYRPTGTGQDLDNFSSHYLDSDKAFQDYQPTGTGEDLDNFKLSGYQVILGDGGSTLLVDDSFEHVDDAVIDFLVREDDEIAPEDSTLIDFCLTADDSFEFLDEPEEPATDDNRVFNTDSFDVADDSTLFLVVEADDSFETFDDPADPFISPFADDSFDFDDDCDLDLLLPHEDTVTPTDTASMYVEMSADDALQSVDQIQIRKSWEELHFTTSVQIKQRQEADYSTDVSIVPYDPAPVNDLENEDNDFAPTVIINGETVVSNEDTVITGNTYNYISVNESAIIPGCDLKSLEINHQLGSGGSFTAVTYSRFASKGDIITLAGLKCLVVDIEEVSGDAMGDEVITTGTVGDVRLLNKELLLILDTSDLSGLTGLSMNTPLQQPSSLQWTTCSEAAQAIANAVHITLLWLAPDAPLLDLVVESGTTVEAALQSLAQRVNGFLVNDGSSLWAVIDPRSGYGTWAGIPNCGLFGTKSFRVKEFLDLKSGFAMLPIKPTSTGSVSMGNSLFYGEPTPKEPLQSFSQTIKAGDAPTFVPLNGDYDKFYMQVLLPTTDSRIVLGKFMPGSQLPSGVVMVPKGTVDPKNWFEHDFTRYKDTLGKEYILADHNLFHADLVDNQFTLSIGYTRAVQPLAEAYAQQQQEAEEKRKLEDQYNQERLRYFNTRTATINFKFFGSLPLPGNRTILSYKDKSINGTITSMQFVKTERQPPEVTITVQEFVEINQLMPRSIIDYYFATGTTP